MASYSHRVLHSEDHEWTIPAAEPWGSTAAEVGKAWTAAENSYRREHGLPKDATLPDTALHFHVGDDQIIIRFTIKKLRTP